MPYANKNPNEDFIFFLKVLIFVLLVFYLLFGVSKIAGANCELEEGDWVDTGFYFSPETEAITPCGYYTFDDGEGHFLGELPSYPEKVSVFFFKGVVGDSSDMGGSAYLGYPWSAFDYTHNFNWSPYNPEQDEDWFVAILETDQRYDFVDYFTGATSTPPSGQYHVIPFKWGQAGNDINFEEPQGFQYGNAPIDLDVVGDYFISSSTIYWDGIQVEMTYYPPFGTTTPSVYYEYIVFQNSQNEGEGTFDSEVDDIEWTAAIDGSYAYRARFFYEVYDYISYSEWIYNDEAYWLFRTGDYDLESMPKMEDYYATTTDFGLLGNMFRDVLIYLFKPNDSVLDFWRTIKDRVRDKPPFGYYALIRDAFDDLSFEATPAFALQTATSTASYIFNPLKNGLSWVLWILFGVWFLKRFVHFVV